MNQGNPLRVSTAALLVRVLAFLILVAPLPSKAVDVSGTYVSEITANTASYSSLFKKSEQRNLVIVIEQDGNEITGYNDEYNLKISGTLEDDVISFFTWPSDISNNEIKGEWKINPDGKTMEGSWRYSGIASGKWNLTKGDQAVIRARNADSPKMQRIAAAEVARLSAPMRPLSDFAQFELEPVTLSVAIQVNKKKADKARELETKLQAKLTPLLNQWNAASDDNASGKLVIRPSLQKLKIVSSGAKFWAGAFTGSSFIDMELVLVDASSDKEISRVLIRRSSTQDAEFTLTNKNDELVIDYVVSIAYEYLAHNNELTNSPTMADVLGDDGSQASVEFIGMAASEISSKTYDKKLWRQSGNLAKGDAEKQSGIYIKLRSKQLADNKKQEQLASLASESAKTPKFIADVSGTYISEITASGNASATIKFLQKKNRKEITLVQTGNTITGADGSKNFEIIGTREEGIVNFYIVRANDISGVWQINADATELTGKWDTDGGGGASGKWNLKRVGPSASIIENKLVSSSISKSLPSDSFNISGTYMSSYTGKYLKRSPDFRNGNLQVTLEQDGMKITGTFGSNGKVWGDIIGGETIRFELFAEGGYSRKGTWKIDPVNNILEGKMISDEAEEWNLTKIQ